MERNIEIQFQSLFSSVAAARGIFEAGLVFSPEDYRYSSAMDYAGENGLLEDVIVVR